MSLDDLKLKGTLKHYFGFDSLRPGQVPIVDSIMRGEDSLSILKTSGGKSLCFQLPTMHRDGLTLVVSPLISLMKDQVDALQRLGISADFVNSSLEPEQIRERYNLLATNGYKLFYASPERFQDEGFLSALCNANIQMVTFDEAHCASQWGHTFRPDYSRLGHSVDAVERRIGRQIQRIALTATATAKVQEDIVNILGLRDAKIHMQDFDRENLVYGVINSDKDRSKDIESTLRENPDASAIIYCVTVKEVERMYHYLLTAGLNVGRYHGKLENDEKTRVQEAFLADEIRVMVATSAFGMGVDKPNVRLVLHAQMPGSLEAFVQEAGRAGRDGLPAKAILFYNAADRGIHQFFIGMSSPDPKAIRAIKDIVYRTLVSGPEEINVGWLATICREEITPAQVGAVLNLLVGQGELVRRETVFSLGEWNPEENYLWVDEIRRNNWQKVNAMQSWCETTLCRRWSVLKYFGRREAHTRCGTCDTCMAEAFSKGKATGSHRYIRPITLINLAQSLDRLAKAGTVHWKQVLLGMTPTASLTEREVEVAGRFTNYAVGDLERWRDLLVKESMIDNNHVLTPRGESWIGGKVTLSLHDESQAPEVIKQELSPIVLVALKRWRKLTAYQADISESEIATEAKLLKLAGMDDHTDTSLVEVGFSTQWVKKFGKGLQGVFQTLETNAKMAVPDL
jgi:ATP-dependent DNA helicase RecQ